MNLGLGDVSCLARVLRDGAANGLDLGDAILLKNYEKERKAANLAMSGGVDAIGRLFRADIPIVQAARNLGLGAVNAVGPLKNIFSQYAMGNIDLFSKSK